MHDCMCDISKDPDILGARFAYEYVTEVNLFGDDTPVYSCDISEEEEEEDTNCLPQTVYTWSRRDVSNWLARVSC